MGYAGAALILAAAFIANTDVLTRRITAERQVPIPPATQQQKV